MIKAELCSARFYIMDYLPFFLLVVLVCDKALPAMDFEVLEDFGLEITLAALLATDGEVCFLFIKSLLSIILIRMCTFVW